DTDLGRNGAEIAVSIDIGRCQQLFMQRRAIAPGQPGKPVTRCGTDPRGGKNARPAGISKRIRSLTRLSGGRDERKAAASGLKLLASSRRHRIALPVPKVDSVRE